jgi:hypothetical protein
MSASTLTLNSVQPGSITLNYSLQGDTISGGYYYTLYRSTGSVFAGAIQVTGFGTKLNATSTDQTGTYTDTGLSPSTSYYYWLQSPDPDTGAISRTGYPLRATSTPFTTLSGGTVSIAPNYTTKCPVYVFDAGIWKSGTVYVHNGTTFVISQ